ncbi:HemK/PrmC family methyltransferase [Bacteriovorax sp. PP10]|uniref:peptide chain release factor N(5)-glutamine methyltransferase n=1 Tax=Bacteriovorax antarcticus TaxID=3088717 RepID=A0ABU5VZD9_9BACT|nr:HemK/PrmC family methyltransferase [Bacteriovorax sp. PP10]MEA9356940.1 HemK/PrmC family methyltransferase [Bacteriovorax sp. PP10]
MSILSLDQHLKGFYEAEKKSLLAFYPGLTIHRLRQDIKLHAFLNGVDSEELFEFPYLPHRTHPLTIFFEKLKVGTPLEYITGYAYFYRSLFKVTSDVLIPRSETEILVELASQEIKRSYKNKQCRVADIGTGSGAIGISLLMEETAQLDMVMTDISEAALKLAQENFFSHKFAISSIHKTTFIKSDRLKDVPGEFNLILTNPPYIKKSADMAGVHSQVAAFEPHLALFLDDDIYDQWFNEFFTSIHEKLVTGGVSLVESHENHLEAQAEMARKIGFSEVVLVRDYTNRNRFLKLKK